MGQRKRHQSTNQRVSIHLAGAALALAGLSTSVLVIGMASATSRYTSKHVVISTVKNRKLGTLLVSGKTLYILKTTKAACTTACLKIWPEVLLPKGVTKATAGTGVSAAKLGTVKRAGGALQVTYAGKALYWFSGDTAAGQVHGNVTDTWGTWSDVVTVKPASSSSGSGSSPSPTTSPSAGTSSTPTTAAPTPTTSPVKQPTTTTTTPSSGGVAF